MIMAAKRKPAKRPTPTRKKNAPQRKTSFDEISEEAKSFIKNIEEKLQRPVTIIGTGPAINDVIDRRS